jgi:hypothetical protein
LTVHVYARVSQNICLRSEFRVVLSYYMSLRSEFRVVLSYYMSLRSEFRVVLFWRKIVIFHKKYPKYFRASLRSAQFFLSAPPPNLNS